MNGGSNPRVLYRSNTLIAVDKPQGLIVHGDGTGAPTLTDAVRDLLLAEGTNASRTAACDLQCLQRLDRETSGIVLFSLSKTTQGAYDQLIAEQPDAEGPAWVHVSYRAGRLRRQVVGGQ